MLAFARRQEMRPTSISIPEQIEGIRHLLETTLGPQIRIETAFAGDLNPILADTNQFDLALLNLSVNARDAMPKGGEIKFSAENFKDDAGEQFVALTLADSGVGMDEATLARAAEPFFTTKGVGKGTGLGLSMVHGMIEQLGGKIKIESERGKGTRVTLYFPIARGVKIVETKSSQRSFSSHTSKTVLAVDDDPLVLLNTVAMLEDMGFLVLHANSAKTALELFRRQKVDLIVTDQAMPDVTGIELVQEARKTRPDLPVIIATGYAELPNEDLANIQRLAKPFLQKDLEDAVAGALADD